MKAMSFLERALGRPHRPMSQVFFGDGNTTKGRVYISGVINH